MEDKKLFEGAFFERPKAGAPDFVKGKMSMRVDDAVAFLTENKNEKGYCNFDLLLAKNGESLYFQLNTWKPAPTTETPKPDTQGGHSWRNSSTLNAKEDIKPEDIPF